MNAKKHDQSGRDDSPTTAAYPENEPTIDAALGRYPFASPQNHIVEVSDHLPTPPGADVPSSAGDTTELGSATPPRTPAPAKATASPAAADTAVDEPAEPSPTAAYPGALDDPTYQPFAGPRYSASGDVLSGPLPAPGGQFGSFAPVAAAVVPDVPTEKTRRGSLMYFLLGAMFLVSGAVAAGLGTGVTGALILASPVILILSIVVLFTMRS